MKLALRVVCLVAVAALLASVPARAAEWQPLGKCIVDYRTNPEEIAAASRVGSVAKIKLEVLNNDLVIKSVKVTFADGQTFDRDLNKYVGSGRSQVIDLPTAKTIQKVEFGYEKSSASSDRIATVQLFGSV